MSRYVDVAISTLALSTMPDPREAIREIHRTLKPGGRFVVMDVKPFEARWKLLNPAAAAIFVPSTNWNVDADPIAAMRDVFGNVRGVKLNRGSAFLAVSHKETG